jgi:hypothetical protein
VGLDVSSLIDPPRSLILSLMSTTCKVLFEVIRFGASSRHPRRGCPEGDIRDADLLARTSLGLHPVPAALVDTATGVNAGGVRLNHHAA